jgi:hypothetical protein
MHVVGDPGGTPNPSYAPVFGIYNDDDVNRVNVTNNTVGHATRAGIYNHHTQYITASNNRYSIVNTDIIHGTATMIRKNCR